MIQVLKKSLLWANNFENKKIMYYLWKNRTQTQILEIT